MKNAHWGRIYPFWEVLQPDGMNHWWSICIYCGEIMIMIGKLYDDDLVLSAPVGRAFLTRTRRVVSSLLIASEKNIINKLYIISILIIKIKGKKDMGTGQGEEFSSAEELQAGGEGTDPGRQAHLNWPY